MGCASSNPLVEGGKKMVDTAKDSVTEAVAKGEHVIHDATESAKEGMEHVKVAVESAMNTAESGISSVVGKVSNTFNATKNDAKDQLETATEVVENKAADAMNSVSETETILASEAESVVELASSTAFERIDDFKDEFGEAVIAGKDVMDDKDVLDALHIEDVEQSIESIEGNYKDMKKKAEDLVNGLPTPATTPPPGPEEKKKDPAPTLWEAAADAILRKPVRPSLDIADSDGEPDARSAPTTHPLTTSDSDVESEMSRGTETEHDLESDAELFERAEDRTSKQHMRPPQITINSETLSVKSYRSET